MRFKVLLIMSRYGSEHPIEYHLQKHNLTKRNLAAALGVSYISVLGYVKNPMLLSLRQILIISGLFGLSAEEFVYLLLRHKCKVESQHSDHGKWHIQEIRDKHKQ